MEANNVIEYRTTKQFFSIRAFLYIQAVSFAFISVNIFFSYGLMDWQLWLGLIAVLGVSYLFIQPQKQIRMRISAKGIEFTQPKSWLLSAMHNIPQHEIAKIYFVVSKPQNYWSLSSLSDIRLLKQAPHQHCRQKKIQIQDDQWESDNGKPPSSVLAEYFPERVERIEQKISWGIASPVADPHALELGKLAEYCMLACVVGGIVGFLITFLNPYEALTWGNYGDVMLAVAAVIASISLLSFMLSKIKILAKVINAVIAVPLFTAAMILLLHGVLMLATDVLSPAQPVLFELTDKTEQHDTWRTAQDLAFKCDPIPQPLGTQKTVSVKQGWFGVMRLNPSGLCDVSD